MPSLPPFILIFPRKYKSVERRGRCCFQKNLKALGTLFQSVRSTDRICFQDAKGFTLLHRQKRHSLWRFKARIDFYETSEMHIISTLAWQKLNRESPRLSLTSPVVLFAFAVRFGKTKNQTTKTGCCPQIAVNQFTLVVTQDPDWSFLSFPGQKNHYFEPLILWNYWEY